MASWIVGAVETYCGAVERGQRRWLEVQEDVCRSWLSSIVPGFPMTQGELDDRIDGNLLVGASVWQAQADTQRDLMLATEKMWAEMGRCIQQQLPDHPPIAVMRQALELGYASGAAMSKASRQAGHFAATNLSATPLKAARNMRKVMRKT
ncbi:hypothetical protein [Chromobacterium sp. IIBBL 290-4]|uniref:hypothetical protein n=1 Tax=Chromobacterium sp. IIBBL 290-4 TaxID=2953890 RepID=UPI0020B7830E|nr:hypothetical protein [Chromobacterium sp. IIBBL 290-4]UTH72971.1 hypothetical protein NKT35_15690 [Chromobacterium sp. IIBBL 290-4]